MAIDRIRRGIDRGYGDWRRIVSAPLVLSTLAGTLLLAPIPSRAEADFFGAWVVAEGPGLLGYVAEQEVEFVQTGMELVETGGPPPMASAFPSASATPSASVSATPVATSTTTTPGSQLLLRRIFVRASSTQAEKNGKITVRGRIPADTGFHGFSSFSVRDGEGLLREWTDLSCRLTDLPRACLSPDRSLRIRLTLNQGGDWDFKARTRRRFYLKPPSSAPLTAIGIDAQGASWSGTLETCRIGSSSADCRAVDH